MTIVLCHSELLYDELLKKYTLCYYINKRCNDKLIHVVDSENKWRDQQTGALFPHLHSSF